ncbi:hypothetical protein AN219_36145 [Streptomyces nanshensis]|nr:hypothetical protein AN219_36145 [Streptomyces nanshensis]
MEPELAALASTAGTTVVTLMATDAWERTRDAVTGLWRRVHPERAESVTAELEATREDLTAEESDEEVVEGLQAEWRSRIRRLLVSRPEVADELRRLLEELDVPGEAAAPAVTQHATATGQARIYQAGRDQHIGEQ